MLAVKFLTLIENSNSEIIAEVGCVRDGKIMSYIKENFIELREYWLMSDWVFDATNRKLKKYSKNDLDLFYETLEKELRFNPIFKILRKNEKQASEFFSDGYFDIVFLNVEDAYQSVFDSCKIWIPKIHKGGYICGMNLKNKGVEKAILHYIGDFESNGNFWYKQMGV